MNILFFLTPKSEVAFIYDDQTLRQALEIMEYHRYTAVPIIDKLYKEDDVEGRKAAMKRHANFFNTTLSFLGFWHQPGH